MKMRFIVALLAAVIASPAFAGDKWVAGLGVNVSTDSVLGFQGEYNLEPSLKAPLILQGFVKNYSQSFNGFGTTYKWSYTGVGVAGLVDLSEALRIPDRKIHPFVGAGLYTVKATLSGTNANLSSPVVGGLYLTGGVRYFVTPQFNVEGSYNNFGSITLGANVVF